MKLRVIIGSVAVVAIGAGVFYWNRASTDAEAVASTIPALPDLSGANDSLRAALAKADDHAHSLWGARSGLKELTRILHANGYLSETVKCYEGLRVLEPEEPRWPHLQATILSGYGQADEAIALWKRTLELAPDYIPARLRLGDIQLKANRTADAEANYRSVLAQTPDEPYALVGLARIDIEAGRLEDARRKLETVVSKTKFALGYDLIVSVYEQLGQRDRATMVRAMAKASGAYRDPPDPWLDGLIDDCYDPYRLSIAAGIIARDGKTADAMQLLRRAIEFAPRDVSAHFQLGVLALNTGDRDTARSELQRCTELAPDFSDGWARLSELQAMSGDPAGSERTLAEGLRRCPQSPYLHLMRARRLRDAGRTGEAIVEFETSIRYRPNEADAYVELGAFLVSLGRVAEAVRHFQTALDVEPGNTYALGILALNAISTGNEQEARERMREVRNQPRMPRQQVEQLYSAFQQQFGKPPP